MGQRKISVNALLLVSVAAFLGCILWMIYDAVAAGNGSKAPDIVDMPAKKQEKRGDIYVGEPDRDIPLLLQKEDSSASSGSESSSTPSGSESSSTPSGSASSSTADGSESIDCIDDPGNVAPQNGVRASTPCHLEVLPCMDVPVFTRIAQYRVGDPSVHYPYDKARFHRYTNNTAWAMFQSFAFDIHKTAYASDVRHMDISSSQTPIRNVILRRYFFDSQMDDAFTKYHQCPDTRYKHLVVTAEELKSVREQLIATPHELLSQDQRELWTKFICSRKICLFLFLYSLLITPDPTSQGYAWIDKTIKLLCHLVYSAREIPRDHVQCYARFYAYFHPFDVTIYSRVKGYVEEHIHAKYPDIALLRGKLITKAPCVADPEHHLRYFLYFAVKELMAIHGEEGKRCGALLAELMGGYDPEAGGLVAPKGHRDQYLPYPLSLYRDGLAWGHFNVLRGA